MQRSWSRWVPYSVLVIGALLFVDFFLGWHRASVSVGGAVDVHGDSSAWAGWGAVAGVFLIVLLLWETLRVSGAEIAQTATVTVISFALALGVAAFTAIEFFAGTASVHTGSVVLVDVSGRQWPAYVGLVLAAFLALVSAAQAAEPVEHHRGRVGLGVR